MKKTVKIIALTAVLILAAVMAASCGADYTKEELCKSAGALIEASYKINEVYFGEGLPISEEDSEDAKKFAEENGLTLENVQFLPVTEESPRFSIRSYYSLQNKRLPKTGATFNQISNLR